MTIRKIVITGGPCAGKTTAMSWIQNAFTQLGYTVLFVPETATELISGGVAPWTCGSNLEYQKVQVRLQLVKEQLFMQAALTMKAEKILMVCDRGAMDNKAYMTDEEFAAVCAANYTNEVELRDGYDAIFHLVTAAKGAEQFYTTENNKARYESVEEAVALDNRLIACWTGHPHLHIIDNSTEFSVKMNHLIAEMASLLGEPDVLPEERKFLIQKPDIEWLEKIPGCKKIEIMQTWLRTVNGEEARIRQRGIGEHLVFFETRTRKSSSPKPIELERRLSRDRYLDLMDQADPNRRPVRKTRYCFAWGVQYINVDIYPDWENEAVAEVEMNASGEDVLLPRQLNVIRELSDRELNRMMN